MPISYLDHETTSLADTVSCDMILDGVVGTPLGTLRVSGRHRLLLL